MQRATKKCVRSKREWQQSPGDSDRPPSHKLPRGDVNDDHQDDSSTVGGAKEQDTCTVSDTASTSSATSSSTICAADMQPSRKSVSVQTTFCADEVLRLRAELLMVKNELRRLELDMSLPTVPGSDIKSKSTGVSQEIISDQVLQAGLKQNTGKGTRQSVDKKSMVAPVVNSVDCSCTVSARKSVGTGNASEGNDNVKRGSKQNTQSTRGNCLYVFDNLSKYPKHFDYYTGLTLKNFELLWMFVKNDAEKLKYWHAEKTKAKQARLFSKKDELVFN
ncbi:hypothetical protein BaRGS_00030692 [Batillaria attramentaria]|uniref:Uncharacterized protein n=1 Tax=Batillaria attramentaria TaxID=370345 RepID=A0ABD0JSK8_9CAEN